MTRDYAGRVVCQAVGCDEPALPWGCEVDLDGVIVDVALCRRHERDALGLAPAPTAGKATA
jgi:hypothetical protein